MPSRKGFVAHSSLLSNALPDPAASEADVYFIEYQEEVPELESLDRDYSAS